MDVARQNAGGIVALGLLGIAWVLTLAGIYTVEGYAVLAAWQFASGVLAAGTFSLGLLSDRPFTHLATDYPGTVHDGSRRVSAASVGH